MSLMPRILPAPSLCFPDARAIVATRAATLMVEEAMLQHS